MRPDINLVLFIFRSNFPTIIIIIITIIVIKLNEKRGTVNARVSARARLIHFLSQEEGAYFKGALILFFKFGLNITTVTNCNSQLERICKKKQKSLCGRSQSSVSLKVLYFSSVTKSFILLLYRTISEVFSPWGWIGEHSL